MAEQIKDSKRMELICEFIKTGKQPEGYKIAETSNGQYRVSQIKSEKETLEAKRAKAQKTIEKIDARLKELESNEESN